MLGRFKADRDEQYVEFLDKCKDLGAEIAKETAANHFTYAELEENDVDLKKLQTWLEKIVKLDFYGATVASEAGERLKGCEALLDAHAQRVFEAHDENRGFAPQTAVAPRDIHDYIDRSHLRHAVRRPRRRH
ncbi:hypothetical protein AWB81_04743 [Caballeronia arationis]|nr:hypothetical protein AWB81_04743 [Caballeronia arationis]